MNIKQRKCKNCENKWGYDLKKNSNDLVKLEKENAKLKSLIEKENKVGNSEFWKRVWHSIWRNEELEKENAELKEQNKKLLESCKGATMIYEDLCKAKEILKELLDFDFLPDIKIKRQAEQFLEATK